MASGRDNKLIGQVGEFLACAELGKRGLIATPFAGNVPTFDVIVADQQCRTCAIQVKANSGGSWRFWAGDWLDLICDKETGQQQWTKLTEISNPTLIYIMVLISREERDRFFVLTHQELQAVCVAAYREYMDQKGWIRPRNRESMENRIAVRNLVAFENRWGLVEAQLSGKVQPYSQSHLTQFAELNQQAVICGDFSQVKSTMLDN
jgi:hypothetical protein